MAREVSFSEIKQTIAQLHNAIEIEMFVHGAVCIAYSGRCMLSSNMCLRDANNGGCAQSCRWVSELSKNGKSLNQQFSMSAKDMRLIKYLNDIKHIGVSAIKIEGRMKSEHYIATIVNAYRKILDHGINVEYINDVASAASREVSCAWFNGSPTKNEMLYHEVPKNVNQIFAMVIDKKINQYTYQVTSRNYFTLTNNFEVLGKNLKHIEPIKLLSIKDDNGLPIRIVNTPMSKLIIEIKQDLDLQPLDMIRIKK
jgi:putative protease